MMWALVPLTPNDDTAARRRCPLRAHARPCVNSRTVPHDQSTCGDGSSACSVLGKKPCPIDSTILMMPATPAAACVCPKFDLIEPSHSGCSANRSCP